MSGRNVKAEQIGGIADRILMSLRVSRVDPGKKVVLVKPRSEYRNNGNKFPPEKRDLVFKRSDGRCIYCGAAAEVVDHIIAKRRGGTDRDENLAASCGTCNAAKRDQSLEQFRLRCQIKMAGMAPLFTPRHIEWLRAHGVPLPMLDKPYTFWFERQARAMMPTIHRRAAL
jgi:hypothetical protein